MLVPAFLLYLIQVSSVTSDCGTTLPGSRIVGGQDTGGLLYPWFALLRLNVQGDPPVCAGSLITPTHILTAAHCFSISQNKPKEDLFTVALGVYNRCSASEATKEVFKVSHVDIHERYSASGKFFDIALMKMDRAAATPVLCLPPKGQPHTPEPGLLIGFGLTRDGGRTQPCHQRQAHVTRYSPQQCAETSLPNEDAQEPTVFCGGGPGIDSCQGDSGGPFLTPFPDGRYMISGIVSYGYGCAKEDLPGVYTDVASYLDWIATKMSKGQRTPAAPSETQHRLPGHSHLKNGQDLFNRNAGSNTQTNFGTPNFPLPVLTPPGGPKLTDSQGGVVGFNGGRWEGSSVNPGEIIPQNVFPFQNTMPIWESDKTPPSPIGGNVNFPSTAQQSHLKHGQDLFHRNLGNIAQTNTGFVTQGFQPGG